VGQQFPDCAFYDRHAAITQLGNRGRRNEAEPGEILQDIVEPNDRRERYFVRLAECPEATGVIPAKHGARGSIRNQPRPPWPAELRDLAD
jgi:hypothetical protein